MGWPVSGSWAPVSSGATSPILTARIGGPGWETTPKAGASLVSFYFAPEDVERVICLMGKESGGNPEARNPNSGAAGLMQVMPFWASRHGYEYDMLFNPAVNLWIASGIRDEQGWGAWTPYQRGECR